MLIGVRKVLNNLSSYYKALLPGATAWHYTLASIIFNPESAIRLYLRPAYRQPEYYPRQCR